MYVYAHKIQLDENQGVYHFCFARNHRLPDLDQPGLEAEYPIFSVALNDIVAIACKISLDDFCGPLAESRLSDLSWVGPRALHHQEIIRQVMDFSPVLPARFASIFSSLHRLEKLMRVQYDNILRFLDEMEEKEEWAVKGFLNRDNAKRDFVLGMIDVQADSFSTLPAGIQYMKKKKAAVLAEKEVNNSIKEILLEVWEKMKPYATDSRERKAHSRGVSGRDEDMIMNWVYLVPKTSFNAFRTVIDQYNRNYDKKGLTLELSGPWPPYSFCPSLDNRET